MNTEWTIFRVHRAGPREKIFFKPEEVKAAIVTCGGLCPGLNDVIRQVLAFYYCLILILWFLMDVVCLLLHWCCSSSALCFHMMQIVITLEIYGVKKIVGIPFGYRGFSEKGLAEMPVSYFNSSSLPKWSFKFWTLLFRFKGKILTLISKRSLLLFCNG